MELKVMNQVRQVDIEVRKSDFKQVESNKVTAITAKDKGYREEELGYSEEYISKSIDKLNTFLKNENAVAEYEVHDFFGDVMIKIVDNNTKEVIMEVPPKKILDLVAKMCEMAGILVDKKA